jgi:hypothetical protein
MHLQKMPVGVIEALAGQPRSLVYGARTPADSLVVGTPRRSSVPARAQ